MKLVIATDSFLPRWDGIASFLDQVIPYLEKEFAITILCPNNGPINKKYAAKIVKFRTLNFLIADSFKLSFANFFTIAKEIKKTNIVWIHTIGPIGILSIIFAKLFRKKSVLSSHTIEWEVFPNSIKKKYLKKIIHYISKILVFTLYNSVNRIITHSREHAEILTYQGIKTSKKIIYLGIDTDHYKPATNKKIAKRVLGIPTKSFIVGFAGRLSLEKDPKTLYRAFARLRKWYKDCYLLIAGGGRKELERFFKTKKNVIVTGIKDDLAPYYKAMDVYVLSSYSETTSLTTLEAMSSGLPVLVTPVGLAKNYVENFQNGFIFKKKDSFDLFVRLSHLYENKKERTKMGINGRNTILAKYRWKDKVKVFKDFLMSL